MAYTLEKNIYKNNLITSAISCILNEYDIKSAHTTALYDLTRDIKLYERLMSKPKLERNIAIGRLMKKDSYLYHKLEDKLVFYLNSFLKANDIFIDNLIETTRDSILVVNKIPKVLKFKIDDFLNVEFVNKEGSYSTMLRTNNKLILYDNITNRIRIKGINHEYVDKSYFVQNLLKPLLLTIENSINSGKQRIHESLKYLRMQYVNSDNMEMYRNVETNTFQYIFREGEMTSIIEFNNYMEMPNTEMVKIHNYSNYVLPLIKYVI